MDWLRGNCHQVLWNISENILCKCHFRISCRKGLWELHEGPHSYHLSIHSLDSKMCKLRSGYRVICRGGSRLHRFRISWRKYLWRIECRCRLSIRHREDFSRLVRRPWDTCCSSPRHIRGSKWGTLRSKNRQSCNWRRSKCISLPHWNMFQKHNLHRNPLSILNRTYFHCLLVPFPHIPILPEEHTQYSIPNKLHWIPQMFCIVDRWTCISHGSRKLPRNCIWDTLNLTIRHSLDLTVILGFINIDFMKKVCIQYSTPNIVCWEHRRACKKGLSLCTWTGRWSSSQMSIWGRFHQQQILCSLDLKWEYLQRYYKCWGQWEHSLSSTLHKPWYLYWKSCKLDQWSYIVLHYWRLYLGHIGGKECLTTWNRMGWGWLWLMKRHIGCLGWVDSRHSRKDTWLVEYQSWSKNHRFWGICLNCWSRSLENISSKPLRCQTSCS